MSAAATGLMDNFNHFCHGFHLTVTFT